jgi:hypothetical protein
VRRVVWFLPGLALVAAGALVYGPGRRGAFVFAGGTGLPDRFYLFTLREMGGVVLVVLGLLALAAYGGFLVGRRR